MSQNFSWAVSLCLCKDNILCRRKTSFRAEGWSGSSFSLGFHTRMPGKQLIKNTENSCWGTKKKMPGRILPDLGSSALSWWGPIWSLAHIKTKTLALNFSSTTYLLNELGAFLPLSVSHFLLCSNRNISSRVIARVKWVLRARSSAQNLYSRGRRGILGQSYSPCQPQPKVCMLAFYWKHSQG